MQICPVQGVSKLEIKILLYIEERKVYSPDSR